MLDSNTPIHDRRTGEVATAAQHMGSAGSMHSRTAHDEAENWHNNTWMSGPAHQGAYKAVIWDTKGKRAEGEAAFPHTHPDQGQGVKLRTAPGMHTFYPNKDVKELHYVDRHHADRSFPSSMEREEQHRASLRHDAQQY
jgi:hypothetical protein